MIGDYIEKESIVVNEGIKIQNEKKKEKRTLIVLTIVFLVLQGLQAYLGQAFADAELETALLARSFMGVDTAIQILLAVCMVTTSKTGYRLANILFAFSVGMAGFRTIAEKSMDAVPGIGMLIAGGIIIKVIHGYIIKLEKNERELFAMAHTDALTDLPNRRALKQRMTALLEEAKFTKMSFAIVMVDLDNFKNINDTVGHDWGDKVLSGIAERWKAIMTERDFMARLGGDEFALLVSGYHSLQELDEHIQKMLSVVSDKFVLSGRDYYISASMGIALYPSDSTETSQLLKYADMAMYAAKYQGKKRICYFDGIMNDVIQNSVEMESVIRHAIESDTFKLVYQPQYQATDKKLRGFEALIRLCDAKGKQVSPAEFISVAEKSSLIIDIDRWVLRNAMADFKPFLETNKDIILSVNISASHMLDDTFLQDVDMIMQEQNFPAKNLELELTESVFVDSLDKAKNIMFEIKKRGIHIALDDFGTGYSSLSYLKELPIDLLKIDKAFVDSIKNGPKEESFVAAIISLSQLMQFAVISEGVEEEYQLNILRNFGCDYIQGFLWGKPLLLDDVKKLMS